jgi:hypothetical protein
VLDKVFPFLNESKTLEENINVMIDNRVILKPIGSEEDFKNINKGLCPDYALCWCDEYNAKYWPHSHDFKGNIEKRLIMNALSCIILRKLNDLRNQTLPLFYVKEVRFNIFKEIIPFDEELPPLDLRYF